MSQTQPPEVAALLLTARGIGGRKMSLTTLSTKPGKHFEECGLNDLVRTWQIVKERRSLDFCWRDGIEYQIIKLDQALGQAVLCPEQIKVLRRIERANGVMWAWRPGFAKFTIEATTLRPYSPQLEDLLGIERNFVRRRKYLRSLLNHDRIPLTLSILPDLQPDLPKPPEVTPTKVEQPISKMLARRRTLSMQIRTQDIAMDRRGSLSAPTSPTTRYQQVSKPRLRSIASETTLAREPMPSEPTVLEPTTRGLQVIFGCHDLREARYLHDQLCVISPVMLAFTASTPVYRGKISQFDVRLKHSSKSTSECKPGEKCSLARPWRTLYPTYLSIDAPKSRLTRSTTNKEVFELLKMEGFDDAIATYCAQGFNCTSPQIMKPDTDMKNQMTFNGVDLFQQFSSGLNPHVQFELPWPNDFRVGFRVIFSAMEVQLTDFSNAACIFFIALLRFAILGFDLDFRLPPHMVAENIAKAHKEDSILVEKFWWRSVRWRVNNFGFASSLNDQPLTTDTEPTQVSIDHIINGDPSRPETVGLSGVLDAYLADIEDSNNSDAGSYAANTGPANSLLNETDMATISKYLAFIRRRAKGTVQTDARLIRNFVSEHADFQADGVLSEAIWYDLVRRIEELNEVTL